MTDAFSLAVHAGCYEFDARAEHKRSVAGELVSLVRKMSGSQYFNASLASHVYRSLLQNNNTVINIQFIMFNFFGDSFNVGESSYLCRIKMKNIHNRECLLIAPISQRNPILSIIIILKTTVKRKKNLALMTKSHYAVFFFLH